MGTGILSLSSFSIQIIGYKDRQPRYGKALLCAPIPILMAPDYSNWLHSFYVNWSSFWCFWLVSVFDPLPLLPPPPSPQLPCSWRRWDHSLSLKSVVGPAPLKAPVMSARNFAWPSPVTAESGQLIGSFVSPATHMACCRKGVSVDGSVASSRESRYSCLGKLAWIFFRASVESLKTHACV